MFKILFCFRVFIRFGVFRSGDWGFEGFRVGFFEGLRFGELASWR